MTGPEHYREAERLLAQVDDGAADWEPIVTAAQVHATLAIAATHGLRDVHATDWSDWYDVAAPSPPGGAP